MAFKVTVIFFALLALGLALKNEVESKPKEVAEENAGKSSSVVPEKHSVEGSSAPALAPPTGGEQPQREGRRFGGFGGGYGGGFGGGYGGGFGGGYGGGFGGGYGGGYGGGFRGGYGGGFRGGYGGGFGGLGR